MHSSTNRKIPLLIVTGFLGSGKTTLLKSILKQPLLQNSMVIINEYGKVAIDNHLVQHVPEHITVLSGGCACCQVRDDLILALRQFIDRIERGEQTDVRVIIETTGLADPAPIAFTILTDPVLQHHLYISGIVTTVDAMNWNNQWRMYPESLKQILVADKLVITKSDLVSHKVLTDLTSKLQQLNPLAEILETSCGEVAITSLLSEQWNERIVVPHSPLESDGSHQDHTQSVSIRFDEPLDWVAFGIWLSMLLHSQGQNVLRVKGILDVGDGGPVVLQGVQHVIHPPEHLPKWPGGDRNSRLIFILRNVSSDQILSSLESFQLFIGSSPYSVKVDSVS